MTKLGTRTLGALVLAALLCAARIALADVVRDGSIGPSAAVQPAGPNFVVSEAMGQLQAANLFHSFAEFDLDAAQSAVFTATSPVDNVIARITGGSTSRIDGLLQSTIPNASLFLLNPQGFLFGSSAAIDVDGGLYVSSADTLQFADGIGFPTGSAAGAPLLSAAAPAAFGFLSGDMPSAITIAQSELEHGAGRTIALIGGDLSLDGASIEAESGEISLIAAGAGSQVPVAGPLALASRSDIRLSGGSELDVSGDPAGTIRIHAANLTADDTSLSATTEGSAPGATLGLDVDVTDATLLTGESELSVSTEDDGDAGGIRLRAGELRLEDEAQIVSETSGAGNAGAIDIAADRLTLDGDAEIGSDVEDTASGAGGSVSVAARLIEILGNAEISSDTDAGSSGAGGTVNLSAAQALRIDMDVAPGEEGGIFSNTEGSGAAGSINVQTPALLVDGGLIFAGTSSTGDGGNIDIAAHNVVVRDNGALSALSEGAGDAGNIRLTGGGSVRLSDGGRISAESELSDGGNIAIGPGYRLVDVLDSTITANVNDGIGGNIDVTAQNIVLDGAAVIAQAGAGQGGRITLTSATFFSVDSLISASAGPAGISGTVTINAPDIDLTGSLDPLPSDFLDAASLIRSACETRQSNVGHFAVEYPRGRPSTVEGLPSRIEYDFADLDPELAGVLQRSLQARREAMQGPLAKLRALLASAEAAVDSIRETDDRAYALIHIANSYRSLASTESLNDLLLNAYSSLVRARALAGSIADARALSFVQGNLARLYAAQSRLDEGLLLARRALQLAEQAEAPSALYRWHWLEGELLWAKGRSQAAIEAYRRAVAVLEAIRHESVALQGVPSFGKFNADFAPVYLSLIDALLRASELVPAHADRQVLLAEARATLEQYKGAEIRNYFQDECATALQEKATSLDALAESAAVVYPILLDDRVEILVSAAGEIARYTVAATRRQVALEARRFRHALGDLESLRYLRHAQQLHRWLVAPYVDELRQRAIDTIVFVPDKALRSVPLGALYDGEKHLIDRFAIVVTPGLDLVDPQRLAREAIEPLLAGVAEPTHDYPALPNVKDELLHVADLYQSDVLLDEQFALDNLAVAFDANRPSILHIASHAAFGDSTGESFVLTHEGRVGIDELIAVIERAKFREQPLELLVLSACETASGNDQAALGLAGLAVKAGARSVVGTLWSISDEAARAVLVEFYDKLGDARYSKAEALRHAQLAVKARPAFAHPFFWSPFLLINNWL